MKIEILELIQNLSILQATFGLLLAERCQVFDLFKGLSMFCSFK